MAIEMPQRMVVQVLFGRVRKEGIVLRQVGNEVRAALEKRPGRTSPRQAGGTAFFAEPIMRRGIGLTHPSGEGAKGPPPGQAPNQFPDVPLLKDIPITISVIAGPSKGLVYEMKERCITLGRTGGAADLQFDEPEASEIHCIIAMRQNGVCLYDAVSIHGTYVNDQRIAAAELTDMSTFRVGSSLLLVKVHPNQPVDIC